MYKKCCEILGVEPGAGIDDIRKAYRKQAKLLHPDVNPSTEAHNRFIRLKTAFDYLIQYHDLLNYSKTLLKNTKSSYHKQEYYEFHQRFYAQKKKVPDDQFLDYTLGKIIYIFFHLVFIGVGIFLVIRPSIALVRTGVREVENPVASLLTLLFAIIFGTVILGVIFYSSQKVFKHK